MLDKKTALETALKTLGNSQAAVDEFIHSEGCEGLIFQELSVFIPVAAAYLAYGDTLDFEDPDVQSKYVHNLILMEGAISICKKIAASIEDTKNDK